MQGHEVWVRFQFAANVVDGPIILTGIVKVLRQAAAGSERQESIEFLLFRFGFSHAVHSQQVKRVPVVYQLWVEFARPRVFTLSPGKIPIVPVSDSAQHRMRIGNCLVQLQRLHYSRSTLGKIFRWRFAGPIQSHINIAESRISHRVLWIEGYGLLKILDAFVYSLRIQLAHEEVRLEEGFVRLLILGVPLLQALCFFVIESDQQAMQDFGTKRILEPEDVVKLFVVTFIEERDTITYADQVGRHVLMSSIHLSVQDVVHFHQMSDG